MLESYDLKVEISLFFYEKNFLANFSEDTRSPNFRTHSQICTLEVSN